MRSFYLLVSLLLCSAPAFAQGDKNQGAVDHKGQAVLPVTQALPGEEKLTARERAERDFLMPVRRKQAAALKASQDEATQQATADASFIGPREPEPEEAAAPAAKAAPHHAYHSYHRRSSGHHRTSSATHRRKSSGRSGSAKKKVVHKPARRHHR